MIVATYAGRSRNHTLENINKGCLRFTILMKILHVKTKVHPRDHTYLMSLCFAIDVVIPLIKYIFSQYYILSMFL